MAQLAKFHEKAIVLYGCKQLAEGVSVVNDAPTGTITTTVGSAAVVGVGTLFTTEAALGSYIYNSTGTAIIGQIIAIADNTHCTLDAVVPASATLASSVFQAVATAVTGTAFRLGLGPKNAIPTLNLTFSVEIQTDSFQYSESELTRDEVTYVKDTTAKFDFETILQTRGTMAGTDPVWGEIPLSDWYEACGFASVYSTASGGYYKITNSVPSNAFLTVEVRRGSADISTAKTYVTTDARGTIDFDGMVGGKPKLKFSYNANLSSVSQKLVYVPNFKNGKTDLSPVMKKSTISLAALDLYSGSTEPSPSGSSNVGFDKLTAPNLTGFKYDRYQLSIAESWTKGAEPTDLTLTVLEDSSLATYNPYAQIENLHRLTVQYSDSATSPTAGKRIELVAHKLQLTKVTQSKIASYAALDLNFRNTGTFDIKFY